MGPELEELVRRRREVLQARRLEPGAPDMNPEDEPDNLSVEAVLIGALRELGWLNSRGAGPAAIGMGLVASVLADWSPPLGADRPDRTVMINPWEDREFYRFTVRIRIGGRAYALARGFSVAEMGYLSPSDISTLFDRAAYEAMTGVTAS